MSCSSDLVRPSSQGPYGLAPTHGSVVEISGFPGGYRGGATPVPISNTEVKPVCAYGTARMRGRVGRCRGLETNPAGRKIGGVFCVIPPKIYNVQKPVSKMFWQDESASELTEPEEVLRMALPNVYA